VCTDTHPGNNPCTYPENCSDGQEGGLCHCPPGMSGYGRKIGTGCQKNFPLATVLGNFLTRRMSYQVDDYLLFLFHSCSIVEFSGKTALQDCNAGLLDQSCFLDTPYTSTKLGKKKPTLANMRTLWEPPKFCAKVHNIEIYKPMVYTTLLFSISSFSFADHKLSYFIYHIACA
jgi:hypothetical protein